MGRVISYPEKTGVEEGDFILMDSGTAGTKKIKPSNLVKIDAEPTQNSANAVSSGGVYEALADAASDATAQELLDAETRYTELTNIILGASGKFLDDVADKFKENNDWLDIVKNETVNRYRNGLKLAVIGDSLSAPIEGVIKYHDLLAQRNNYEVTNLSVGSTGYTAYGYRDNTFHNRFFEQANRIPSGTEAVIVFGSFNDCNMLDGRAILVNPENQVRGMYSITANPSSTATELTVNDVSGYYYTHNVTSAKPAGTYRMNCNGTIYQFTTDRQVNSGGKIQIRINEIGNIDSTDIDNLAGAFKAMLDVIYTKNNSMLIGIVSPAPWKSYNLFEPQSETRKQRAINYNNLLKQLAEIYSLPFLDLFHGSNLRPWDADFRQKYYLSADGIHPNALGHAKYLYPHMRDFLSTFNPMII